jgi:hypothetical protein
MFICEYYWLLIIIILVDIGGYYINGYYINGYWCLLY